VGHIGSLPTLSDYLEYRSNDLWTGVVNMEHSLADYLYDKCENSDFLTAYLTGHLVIESLLKKQVSKVHSGVGDFSENMMFSNLIELCFKMEIITQDQLSVLKAINKMRNKFAHNLRYEPSLHELKDIYIKAKNAFSDMTDGLQQGIDTLSDPKWKHEPGDYTLAELFIQIAYDFGLFDEEAP
jgi:hypothetical protein